MRTLPSVLLTSAALAYGLAGCYLVQPPGWGNNWNNQGCSTGQPAELLINVTFQGQPTCALVGVDTVQVGFPGGAGATQSVPCGSAPLTLDITDISSGPLALEINGLSNGTITFDTTETVSVAPGQQEITVNLSPAVLNAAVGTTSLTASFEFGAESSNDPTPPFMSCTEAGVASVSLVFDGSQPIVVPCYDLTLASDGAVIPIAAGTHTLDIAGWSGSNGAGTKLYESTYSSVAVQSGTGNTATFNMAGLYDGGIAVTWNFGGAAESCTSAGVSTVSYSVVDANGNNVLTEQTRGCGSYGFSLSGLNAGVYEIPTIEGSDASSNVLFSATQVRLYAPSNSTAQFVVNLP